MIFMICADALSEVSVGFRALLLYSVYIFLYFVRRRAADLPKWPFSFLFIKHGGTDLCYIVKKFLGKTIVDLWECVLPLCTQYRSIKRHAYKIFALIFTV